MLKNDSQYNKEQKYKDVGILNTAKINAKVHLLQEELKGKKKESRIRKKSNLKSQKQKDNINLCQKEISVRNGYFFYYYFTYIFNLNIRSWNNWLRCSEKEESSAPALINGAKINSTLMYEPGYKCNN